MVVKLFKAKNKVLKKFWTLPEMRHLFSATCELKGPFIILTLRVSPDSKHEKVSKFKSLTVSEKISLKTIFTES